MIAADEDALLCDFAEVYHIYDYRALPARNAAALACGLGPDSRIMRKLSGRRCSLGEMLLAVLADNVSGLLWRFFGGDRPESIYEKLTGKEEKDTDGGYGSIQSFEEARNGMLEKGSG